MENDSGTSQQLHKPSEWIHQNKMVQKDNRLVIFPSVKRQSKKMNTKITMIFPINKIWNYFT